MPTKIAADSFIRGHPPYRSRVFSNNNNDDDDDDNNNNIDADYTRLSISTSLTACSAFVARGTCGSSIKRKERRAFRERRFSIFRFF